MKISDLNNPKAASQAIESMRKRFQRKTCMAPETSSCSGSIISAHTLSKSGVLKPISRDGKVYALSHNSYATNIDDVVNFELKGMSETSVFNGFCSFHDKNLFAVIEDQEFVCSAEQIFTYAYRSVAKETFLKRSQAETSPTVEQIKEIHGITDEQWVANPLFAINQFGSMIGAAELERYKQRLDTIYLNSDWSRLVTHVIQFNKMPTVVCSAPYSPDFDFEGTPLQDFNNVDIDLETLIVNVFPSGTGGFALFSYLDTASSVCEKMVESLLRQPHLTSALIWFLIGQFENIAIQPDWYEKQSPELLKKLKDHFVHTADLSNFQASRLDLCPDFIDEWNPVSIFKI